MLRVVIVGYGEMFTNLIAGTLDSGCEIVGVLRKDTVKYSYLIKKIRDIINPSTEYSYIKSYNLPEINDVKGINDEKFRKILLKLNPDIMLIGSWGEKIEKATYDIPKIASINAHPSLLPKYRGPNPYFWTIKNMEKETGVTFHLIDKGYDTGSILAQEIVKIYPSDTGESLKKRVVLTARGVCCELLKTLNEDLIIPLKQDEDKSSYYSYPDDLELDFNKSAEENYALIRAIYPWSKAWFCNRNIALTPNPHTTFVEDNNTEYKTPAVITYVNSDTKTVSVLCGDGRILKMSNISLYNNCDKPFTKNYIKRDLCEGQIII